jgi:hypothetical protein
MEYINIGAVNNNFNASPALGQPRWNRLPIVKVSNKVLFAADINSYISTQLFGEINKKDAKYKYNRINAGCYIGKVKDILNVLKCIP